MTTKKDKKSVKKTKIVKSDSSAGKTAKRVKAAGGRSKVVVKSPAASEIDKDKMAAFFSAGGLKSPGELEKVESEPVVSVPDPLREEKLRPEVEEVLSEVKMAESSVSRDMNEKQNSENKIKDQNLIEMTGETKMTASEPVKSTSAKDSGSISILPIFVILFCMAAFWLYYISSAPLQKAAANMVEQSQTQILKLENKVKSLQAIIAELRAELKDLRNSAQPRPAAAVKKAVSGKTVKDSSFDKAPVPFWRNYQHPHAKQLEKLNQKRKSSAVKTPAAKVDSFSKAPVPFWRKADGAQSAVKAKDGVHRDSSFDKAPIPFWRK